MVVWNGLWKKEIVDFERRYEEWFLRREVWKKEKVKIMLYGRNKKFL